MDKSKRYLFGALLYIVAAVIFARGDQQFMSGAVVTLAVTNLVHFFDDLIKKRKNSTGCEGRKNPTDRD